jgi:hypothetical protein
VKVRINTPIMAGIISRKQVKTSLGFIIDAIKLIKKRANKK